MKNYNFIKGLTGFVSTLMLSAVFSLPTTQANAALTSCDPMSGDPCFYNYNPKKHTQTKKKKFRSNRFRRSLRTRHKRHSRQTRRVVGAHVKTHCFPTKLRRLMNKVERHFGKKLVLTSGYRSSRYNRRVGGAKRSQHVHCKAVDFHIRGVNKYSLARYVKTLRGVGGVGSYCKSSSIHMDIGPKRSWHWGCGKSKSRKRYVKKRKTRSYRSASYKRKKSRRS